MGQTMVDISTLEITECHCGFRFAVSKVWIAERREKLDVFYCPRGCACQYQGKTELQKAREEAEREKRARERAEQDYRYQLQAKQSAERRLSAQKGQMTKLKKRIHNGVCPCCKRTFTNLARHMESQHPEFAKVEAD